MKEKTYVYQEIKSLNVWLKIIIYSVIAGYVVVPVFVWWMMQRMSTIMSTTMLMAADESYFETSMDQLQTFANINIILSAIYVIIFIVSVILICIWINRSHKNARALGVTTIEQSPAWAVGSFFIPIISFFVPYQAMKGLVSGSLNLAQKPFSSNQLSAWWATWIIGLLLSRISSRWTDRLEKNLPENPSIEQLQIYTNDMMNSMWLDGVASICLIISAILLLKIIKLTNETHRELNKKSS